MQRILCIASSLGCGGAETWIMKIFRELDKEKYCIDFCVTTGKEQYYTQEIISYGGKIHVIPAKQKSLLGNFCALRRLIRDNEYVSVLRLGGSYIHVLDLLTARLGGTKRIALRSINSSSDSKLSCILSFFCRPFHRALTTIKIAPSSEAAQFVWGARSIKTGEITFFPNALPLDEYAYSQTKRNTFRTSQGISSELVIGHIGRFENQKNHLFLLEIFTEIHKIQPQSVLCLCGIGSLQEKIKQSAKKLGIADAVRFLGLRDDVGNILSGFDVFIFPSFYEGMPNTVLEAQASGLPCIISDTITRECNITCLVQFKHLQASPKLWAETALKAYTETVRRNTTQEFINAGYDIKTAAKKFVKLLFND